jgi:hypothetical protein
MSKSEAQMDPENVQKLELAEGELASCEILIDSEGNWYHRGNRMHRGDIVAHLCQHLCRDEDSERYIIQMGKQRCYLEVEDAPLVISRVSHEPGMAGDESGHLLLTIKHLEPREPLDPTTLRVGRKNVLYCLVQGLPARFTRPAYYQLAEFIHEDQGGFYLSQGGKRYTIEQFPRDVF